MVDVVLCVGCGKHPPKEGVKRCEHCLAYQRQMSRNYQENLKMGIRRKPGRPRKEPNALETLGMIATAHEIPVLPSTEEVAVEGPLDISGEIDIEM